MNQLTESAFCLDPDLIYLNHAAVAPWPVVTQQAVSRFAQQNATTGAEHYPDWLKQERQLREQLRQLINAPHALDIALLKNTSEALSVVAYGLPWQPGDNILISDQEFPSNRIVWESLANQGVQVRAVDLNAAESPEAALMAAADQRTRLLSISAIQYASGLKMNLQQLGRFCREHQILFCVDAIQSLGAMQFDVQQIQADFVMADGHKWMLAPEGLALFYCRAELRDQLELHQFGWHMTDQPGNYDSNDWRVSRSATRFECGSPNMLSIHAMSASLQLLLDTGLAEVEQRVMHNARYLMQLLQEHPDITVLTPTEPTRHGGIVTFRHERIDARQLYPQLMKQRVICACRGGGIRFSPHFYNSTQQLEQAVKQTLAVATAQ